MSQSALSGQLLIDRTKDTAFMSSPTPRITLQSIGDHGGPRISIISAPGLSSQLPSGSDPPILQTPTRKDRKIETNKRQKPNLKRRRRDLTPPPQSSPPPTSPSFPTTPGFSSSPSSSTILLHDVISDQTPPNLSGFRIPALGLVDFDRFVEDVTAGDCAFYQITRNLFVVNRWETSKGEEVSSFSLCQCSHRDRNTQHGTNSGTIFSEQPERTLSCFAHAQSSAAQTISSAFTVNFLSSMATSAFPMFWVSNIVRHLLL